MSKLDERRKKYNIPPAPYGCFGDDIIVYRLPYEEKVGMIYLPQNDEAEPESRGVLVAAGLGALDVLADHLGEVGDIVWFGTFDGEEKHAGAGKKGRFLQMKISAIRGSEDKLEREQNYTVVRDAETGQHRYEPRAVAEARGKITIEQKTTKRKVA